MKELSLDRKVYFIEKLLPKLFPNIVYAHSKEWTSKKQKGFDIFVKYTPNDIKESNHFVMSLDEDEFRYEIGNQILLWFGHRITNHSYLISESKNKNGEINIVLIR